MKSTAKGLIVALAVLLGAAGCDQYEKEFSESRYGMEMEGMMDVCMEMQKSGALPGIAGGEDRSLKFETEQVDFSKKDEVAYPLQIQCMVIKGDETTTFTFRKGAMDADWALML